MQNQKLTGGGESGSKQGAALVIVVVIIVLMAVAIFMLTKKEAAAPTEQNAAQNANESQDGFPSEFFSYTGSVVRVEDGRIRVLAPANGNYLNADTELSVVFDETTKFTRVALATEGPVTEGTGTLFQRTDISGEEMKVGDKVTVIAGVNVKGKTEFTAIKIEVR